MKIKLVDFNVEPPFIETHEIPVTNYQELPRIISHKDECFSLLILALNLSREENPIPEYTRVKYLKI